MECTSSDDCFGQFCDQESGLCICTEAPELCLDAQPSGLSNGTCYAPNEEVVVHVTLSNSSTRVAGSQFYVGYDPTAFAFVSIEPGNVADPTSPFEVELSRTVNEVDGRIFYAIGVALGGEATRGPAILATIRFRAIGACATDQFCFIDDNPQVTRLVDEYAQSVSFTRCCSEVLTAAGPPPVLNCPASKAVNADAGSLSATVYWPTVTASGGCGGPVDVFCLGENSEGAPADHLAMNGGSIPDGVTEFSCTAMDACGAIGVCSWNVEIRELNTLSLDVQLSPMMARGPVQRCIEFQLYSSCDQPPVTVTRTVEFGYPRNIAGMSTDIFLEAPANAYFCATARDTKHTLRSTAMLSVENGIYTGSFSGDPSVGGNWLINGNLDGNTVINSTDDAILGTQWQTTRPANTPCGTPGFHADINGDGVVNLIDRGFVQQNAGKSDMPGCCDNVAAAAVGENGYSALSEAGSEELQRMGVPIDLRADMDRNGVVDDLDVVYFLQRERRRQIELIPSGD
jgi:hypothetical protein